MRLRSRLVCLAAGVAALSSAPTHAQVAPDLVPVPELGLRIQRGFRVELYADSDLADDIQAMAIDARGRVVVTGPGYIKILEDTTGRGHADRFKLLATPSRGGAGLCCDGPILFFFGNGWLSRYEDLDGDDTADRPPENLWQMDAGEPGARPVRKGPDGSLYLAGIPALAMDAARFNVAGAPVREPAGGVLVRLPADGRGGLAVAHGFLNPGGFDFDAAGEMFLFDSGLEAGALLPWHAPARFFHVATAGHHGWRSNRRAGGWAWPQYYLDAVDDLAHLGPGRAAGLVCYRHKQFPASYRGGLFALDWEFGSIHFVSLAPEDGAYHAQLSLFLEPLGTAGFTPTDICVAPDGSLFVCTGGRKTRGAVYRISYAGQPLLDPVVWATPNPEVNAVLTAPQPLEGWSRAHWVPEARRLGDAPFLRAVADEAVAPLWRVRAIEILTELFGGLPPAQADLAAASESPLVRARAAWALDRFPGPNPSLVLFRLLGDPHPLVRCEALAAVASHLETLDSPELVRLLFPSLGHPDRRVRQSAARVASLLSEDSWRTLSQNLAPAPIGERLTGLLAQMWRNPDGGHPETLGPLAAVLAQNQNPVLGLDALRLVILALGDWNVKNPALELSVPCEAAALPPELNNPTNRLRVLVRAQLTAASPEVKAEAARLVAMWQDNDPRVARLLLGLITPRTSAAADFQVLVCLSRLRAWPPDLTPRVAAAVLDLDRKLAEAGHPPRPDLAARLTELVRVLLAREPKLGEALLGHPDFARATRLEWVRQLGPEHQLPVARLYLAAVRRDAGFPWSASLVELLSLLPDDEVRPLFRVQWTNAFLRDELLILLAARPDPADRDKFWEALGSWRPEVARTGVSALLQLPPDPARTNLLAPLSVLQRLLERPQERDFRRQVVALINGQTGENFVVKEPDPPEKTILAQAAALQTAYQPVFAWVEKKHPQVLRALPPAARENPLKWHTFLKSVPWATGDRARGGRIFAERGCAECHAAPSSLGPDLLEATVRLSAEDFFDAVIFPSRNLPEPYRSTVFLLRGGRVVSGLVAFESSEVVIVQTDAAITQRLEQQDIAARQPGEISFMPPRLLEGATPQDLADLYRFLKTLPPRR